MAIITAVDIKELTKKHDVQGLIKALDHKDPMIQQLAVEALGDLRDARAIEALGAFMNREYEELSRVQAQRELNRRDTLLFRVAVQSLGFIGGGKALRKLMSVGYTLHDPFYEKMQETIIKTIQKLKFFDDTVIDDYFSVFTNPISMRDEIEKTAIEEISHWRGPEEDEQAITRFCEMLEKDYYRFLFGDIVEALCRYHDVRTVKPILRSLRTNFDSDQNTPRKIVGCLSNMGSFPVEVLLEELNNNEEILLRSYALEILRNIHDPKVITPLISAFQKEENGGLRRSIMDALLTFGTPIIEPMMMALETATPENRGQMLISLAKIGTPSVFEPIEQAFKDPSPTLRSSAIYAAAILGDERFFNAVQNALFDPDEDVRWSANKKIREFKSYKYQ